MSNLVGKGDQNRELAIMLYFFRRHPNRSAMIRFMSDIVAQLTEILGRPPDTIGSETVRMKSYARVVKRLEELLSTSYSVELEFSSKGGTERRPAVVSMSIDKDPLGPALDFGVSIGRQFVGINSPWLRTTLLNLARKCKPLYGYVDVVPGDSSPILEAGGVTLAGKDYTERESRVISGWFNGILEGIVQKSGHIRDVYPWNIVTQLHLDQTFGGKTLRQHISESPRNGTLEHIHGDTYLWKVETQEIPRLTEEMEKAGRIFNYVEQVLKPRRANAKPPTPEEGERADKEVFGSVMRLMGHDPAEYERPPGP